MSQESISIKQRFIFIPFWVSGYIGGTGTGRLLNIDTCYAQHYQRTELRFKNIFVIACATCPQQGTETNDAHVRMYVPKVHSSSENELL